MNGIFSFKVKTVGTFDPETRSFRRTSKWYKRGVADILGIYKGKFLAIEVKTEKGRPNPNQKLFLQDVLNNGGIAFIARSVEEVEQELKKQDEPHASVS